MSIDYSVLPLSKPRPAALDKKDKTQARVSRDERLSAEVRVRSRGRCEMNLGSTSAAGIRCHRRATEVHHLLGGNGRRGYGDSALPVNKAHLCQDHHALCTQRVITCHRTATGWLFKRAV